MKKTLIYQEGSGSIRQMPDNYLVAHRGNNGGWVSDPDLAADPALCVKVYRTINHSYANRYKATGQEVVDMATKL
jgi:hypothetical protein